MRIPLSGLFSSLFLSALVSCDLPTSSSGGSSTVGSGSSSQVAGGNTTILAFGDSLTSGGGKISNPYPGQLSRMTGRPVVSSGAGGETLPRGAARFPGVYGKNKPGTVVIMEGTNDAASGASLAAAEAGLESMVVAAKAGGSAVIVATIPPFQKGAAAANPRVIEVNNRIRAVASRQGVPLADVYSAFGSNGTLTQSDGIHISNEGAGVIAATVADRL